MRIVNIWLNKQWRGFNVILNYAKINTKSKHPSTTNQIRRGIIWIKNEIKFLFKKKEITKKELFNLHLN